MRRTSIPALRRLPARASRLSLCAYALAGLVAMCGFDAPSAHAQTSITVTIPATGNPWLAGMPDGSAASAGDSAPAASPLLVPMTISSGMTLRVSNADGLSGYSPGVQCGPDGCPYNYCHSGGAENGIAGACWGTVSALIGVFLDDTVPTSTPVPADTDFTTPESMDYTELHPLLKQVFFIGDGRRSDGTQQTFVAPQGATRLFLGTGDGSGWYNNPGSFTATVTGGCAGISSNPSSAIVCPDASAGFTVGVTGAGPFTYQWQLQTAPGVWMDLGDVPVAMPCDGHAVAYATPNNAAQVSIGLRACPGNPTAAQRFQVRAVVQTPCGTLTSSQATYTICPADINCSGSLNVQDIFDFLNYWFAGSPFAEFNHVGGLNVQDIFDFLAAWFAGC